MQRTLSSFGLLFLAAVVASPVALSQDTPQRRSLLAPFSTKKLTAKKGSPKSQPESEKESSKKFWSNTSKWKERLLPFTAEKKDAEQKGKSSSSAKKAGRLNFQKSADRGSGATQNRVVSPPQNNARNLVTMPAMTEPPSVARSSVQPFSRATKRPQVPAGPAQGARTTNQKRDRSLEPPVVSSGASVNRKTTPQVTTSSLRAGGSSRRQHRVQDAARHSDAADSTVTGAKIASGSQDRREPNREPKNVKNVQNVQTIPAVGKKGIADARKVTAEVRASDRPTVKQPVVSQASQRGGAVTQVSPRDGAVQKAAVSRSATTKDPVQLTIEFPKTRPQSPVEREQATAAVRSPKSSVASPAVQGVGSSRRPVDKNPLAVSGKSRVNPLQAGRAKKQPMVKAGTGPGSVEVRPTRVSARLGSRTVGTELGGSLLFSKSPQLSVETLGPRQVVIGKEATFKVRLQNLGEPVAESVLVRINTPLGAQIVAAQASRGQTNSLAATKQKPLEWRLDRLESHGTEFLTLRIVPRKSESFDLGITWTLAPIASQTRIKVQEPKLNLEINGPHEIQYGETKIYRLTITNPGNGLAENVQLKLKPLDGGGRPMAVRNIGAMEPGAKQVLEVELTARNEGYLNVEAIAMADTDLTTTARQRVLVRRAQLTVAANGPEMNYAGTTATYRFRVANQGNSSAENIRIVATLPTGGEYLESSEQGEWNAESRQVVWNVPALVAQNNKNFEIRASLSHPGENTFQVRLSADDDLAAAGEVMTLVEALADLQLVINDPRGPVPVEEETTYEVLISNRGTKAAEMVDVVVFFSEGIEPISVSGGTAKVEPGQVVFHPIEHISPGEEVVYKIAARANRSGNHVFRTEVACEAADVRLVAEESTRFYGSGSARSEKRDERPAVSSDEDETDPQQKDLPEYRQEKS